MSPTTMPDRARLISELAGSELSSNLLYAPLPKASPMAWVVVSVLLRSCSSRTIEPGLASCSVMNPAAGLRCASCLTTVAPIVAAAATQTARASSVGGEPASSIAKVAVGGWSGLGEGSTTARPAHWARGWQRVRCNGEQATSRIVCACQTKMLFRPTIDLDHHPCARPRARAVNPNFTRNGIPGHHALV